MFFLLKCAFWLALVYAAMLYGFGPARPVSHDTVASRPAPREVAAEVARTGQAAVQDVMNMAGAGLTVACAHRPAACLADAARLEALFDASGSVDPIATARGAAKTRRADRKSSTVETGAAPIQLDVPMPVADPRRQGRVSRLTSRL